MKSEFLICLGTTGGHIFPGLAIANELQKKDKKILLVNAKVNNKNMPNINFDHQLELIDAKPFIGSSKSNKFKSIFYLIKSFFESLKMIKKYNPNVLIGSGGFVWVPISLAGWIMRKKVYTLEGNFIPGLANKIASKISTKIYTNFEGSKNYLPKNKCINYGYPVREKILKNLKRDIDILLVGGSQGAENLNLKFATQLENLIIKLKNNNVKIVHQTGINDYKKILSFYIKLKKKYNNFNFIVEPFINDLYEYLGRSKILISRGGASTIAESLLFNLNLILVPLKNSANNHQYLNCIEMRNTELAEVWLENEELYKLTDKIIFNLKNDSYDEIATKKEKFFKRNSTKNIVNDILNNEKN